MPHSKWSDIKAGKLTAEEVTQIERNVRREVARELFALLNSAAALQERDARKLWSMLARFVEKQDQETG